MGDSLQITMTEVRLFTKTYRERTACGGFISIYFDEHYHLPRLSGNSINIVNLSCPIGIDDLEIFYHKDHDLMDLRYINPEFKPDSLYKQVA